MVNFNWRKDAGLISIFIDDDNLPCYGFFNTWAVQFILPKKYWQIGFSNDWKNDPFPSFGVGPLFLITWIA